MSKQEEPRENTTPKTHEMVASLLYERFESGRVLDLPCGEGAFAERIMERGFKVWAGDVVPILRVPGVEFKQCDMNAPLPFPDETFDAVVCIDGIEHIERPFDFVRECARVVRDDGALLVSTPNISALRSRWRWLLTGFHNKGKSPLNEGKPSPLHHIGLLSFPDLRYMLHTNGFRIDAIRSNRIKAVSWLYSPLVALCAPVTAIVFRGEEKDVDQRTRNREIFRQMFSRAVAFGETLVIRASRRKRGS